MEKRKRNPLVSVVMPAYNAESYIEQAVRSVQRQTVTDWELIAVDDGSTDGTREILRRLGLEDRRIRLVCSGENLGTARSRNRGIEESRGNWIALLDSDDVWRETKLQKQLDLARRTGADLIYSSYGMVDEGGKQCCPDYLVPACIGEKGLLRENVIGCSTVLLSHEIAERYRFSAEYAHEDYAFWLRLLREGYRFAGVREVLADYRVHGNSRSFDKLASARRRWQVYEGMELSLPLRGWYLMRYALGGMRKYRRA